MAKFIKTICDYTNRLSMVALVLMMLLITVEALGRYFFGQTVPSAYELVKNYFMVMVAFLGIAYTHYQKDHIRFELLLKFFSDRTKAVIDLVNNILILLFFSLIFIQGVSLTWEAWVHQSNIGGLLQLPLFLSYIWVPLGTLTLCLLILYNIFEFFTKLKVDSASTEDLAYIDSKN